MKRRASQSILRLFVIMIVTIVTVTALATVGFAQEESNNADKECYLTGDMNADGVFDNQDAYHTLFGLLLPEKYPMKRGCDFNQDQQEDQDDAIALLYAYMLPDLYSEYTYVYDMVHDYFDPAWKWEETVDGVTATVTVQCACGEPHLLTAADGVVVTKTALNEPSCTQTGSESYTAVVTYDGESFAGNYSKVLPAIGHTAGQSGYDDNKHYDLCANCGEKINAASHVWNAVGEPSAATCQVQAVQKYKCDCGAEKQENLGYAEHDYVYLEDRDVLVDETCCQYAKQYQCSVCGDLKKTDYYNKHNYIAVITEATCRAEGRKVYQCTECENIDAEKTVTIPVDTNKHVWDNGTEEPGAIVYQCTVDGCDAAKKTVTATQDGTVTKDALDQADELKLQNNTTVSLGDAKEGLNIQNEVKIEVGEADEQKLDQLLTPEQKEQLEGITVYDFSMEVDGAPVDTFGNMITITLPYTLQDGEDPDRISVWFIGANGPEEIENATYRDGFVTFQTDHFSYYTVTRLTPEERCAKFGHILTDVEQAATCTADGYIKNVCQRCSYTEVKKVLTATGHSYEETSRTAANCEVFGVVVETCKNCEHEKYAVERALGHNMQLHYTKAATCTEAGYEEYTCQNDGCGNTYQVALAQLTHNYIKDESKTVAASCTAGGYDVYVCEHCRDEVKRNETIALGHDHSTESAQWNEDLQKPAVTLSCSRSGCNATKVLDANVFVKEASCTSGGIVEAIVSYNNKTFKKTLSTDPELGHKESKDWVITDNTHYLLCETCGQKLDTATHNYGEGVVTAQPTCVTNGTKAYTCNVCGHIKEETLEPTGKHTYDDGVVTKEPTCTKMGTKTYTCSVCEKTITENIEATGEHSYEDGKCVSCGKEQQLCSHENYTATPVDLSGYDICEGFKLYLLSCDCGEVQRFEVDSCSCELEEATEELDYAKKFTAACSKCGLAMEYIEGYEFSKDPCVVRYAVRAELTFNGQVLAEYSYSPEGYVEEHPTYKPGEKVEVKLDGFCGMTLQYRTCPCGDAYAVSVEDSCTWQHKDGYRVCTTCGTVCKDEYEQVKDANCLATRKYTTNYYNRDGELIYSYDEMYISTVHAETVNRYELYGDTCADGVKIWYMCVDCGRERVEYSEDSHPTVHITKTDLTDANICADAHIQMVCLCGMNATEMLSGDETCDWRWIGYNKLTDTEIMECTKCKAVKTYVVSKGPENDKCQYLYTQHYTYTDADGKEIVTAYNAYLNSDHNIEVSYELKGSSCTDGVLINEHCVDCDYHNQYESKDHDIISEQEINLEEYGLCPGYLMLRSCACGEKCDSEFASKCQWIWIENGDGLCEECGVLWQTNCTETPLNQCLTLRVENNTFSYEGEELLTFKASYTSAHHRWIYEFELNGTSCEQGYFCTQTCTVCNAEQRWGSSGGHNTYPVKRQLLTNTGLCGDVEIVTMQCACGKNTGTSVSWVGQPCQFAMTGNPKDQDVEVYTCTVCKAELHRVRTEAPVEDDPCMLEIRDDDSYVVNGEEIFRVGTPRYRENHDWVVEYELMGESCTDGVKVKEFCSRCDAGSSHVTNEHYGISQYIDLAELGFCGGELYVYTCPCGEEAQCHIYYTNCQWETVGEPTDKESHNYKCSKCGGTWVSAATRGEDIDECHYAVNTVHTFTPAGKEPVEFVSRGTREEHDWVETVTLMGKLCTDGVQITRTCANCGEHNNEQFYHHRTNKTDVYDLSEYGMCGGTLTISNCYCGKSGNENWESNCKWEYVTGGYGFFVEQCAECKTMRRYSFQSGEKIGTCYRVNTASYTFYTVENEVETVLLNVSFNTLNESHRTVCTFELEEGATCADFYWVNLSCVDCDYTSRWGNSGNHVTYPVSRETISRDQLCGTVDRVIRSCACGEETETAVEWAGDQCSFEYAGYDQEHDCDKYVCRNCNAEKYTITSREQVEGTTCEYLVTERTVYSKNGVELFDTTSTRTQTIHSTVAQTELLGEDCDDGYIYRQVCSACGTIVWEDENIRYGCNPMRVKRELLVPESVGLCGQLYWDTYSCACGKKGHEQRTWDNGGCDTEDYRDEETGEILYSQCKVCGIREVTTRTETPCESPRCKYTISKTVSFLKGDELLFSYDQQEIGYNHRYVYVYHLNGDSCEDGYTYDMQCIWCDDVQKGTETYYDHNNNTIEIMEIIRDGDNVCGEVMLYAYSCACGKNTHQQVNHDCQWESIAGQQNTYRCVKCGMTYENKDTTIRKPGTCEVVRTMDRVYTTADGVVGKVYRETVSNDHVTVYSAKGDCQNGYLRTGYCVYCKVVTEQDEELCYGHEQFRTEHYDLKAIEMCGGYIDRYSCACGADVRWSYSINCPYTSTDERDENGAWIYHCDVCNIDHSDLGSSVHREEDCYSDGTFYFKAVCDGEELLHIEESFRSIRHTWVAADYDGTCDGVVTVYLKCRFCDETRTERYEDNHRTFLKNYIDLTDAGCCGGHIEVYGCACGEEGYAYRYTSDCDWNYESDIQYGEDGCQTGVSVETCTKCGLTVRVEWNDVPTETLCNYERNSTYTISKDGAVLLTYQQKSNPNYHTNDEETYTLVDGATSCEDGVICRRVCKVCGGKEEWTVNYHVTSVVERYDLAEMGSECGGSFVRYACPCGYSDYGQFDSDCGCDMHAAPTDCWVEGTIEGSQQTVDGTYYMSNSATRYTCAQTDPKCGFTVRMAYCWFAEDCVATQYQIWQLGYDADTDTCIKEIRIPTGNQHAYHNYVKTENHDDGDGDDTTSVSNVTYTCTDCQSTCVEEDRFVNGTHVSSELTIINKLENFEERRYELREYAIIEGCHLETKIVKELKKVDGTNENRVDTYAYDFTNGCKATHTWSVNGGEEQQEVLEHKGHYECSEWVKSPSCTQAGIMAEWMHCPTCCQNYSREEHAEMGYGHSWEPKTSGDGYYCTRCLLENSNGADGTIVMEDLTNQYGYGENYVVGYWNRGEDIFVTKVSIILSDGTEILLDGIEVTELTAEENGINAISVNCSAVHAAAQEVLETMESYDVRVALVPADDSMAWDYAITMDGWTA